MTFWDDLKSDMDGLFSTDEAGESVTITPITGEPFVCVAIFHQVTMDRIIDHNVIADSAECHIRHADIAAALQTEPQVKMERKVGWQISRLDLNGATETWYVIDKKWSKIGVWVLLLEKNLRIV